jgi:hypothetical protein
MSARIDLTDRTFSRLTVVGRAPAPAHLRPDQPAYYFIYYDCRCACGKTKTIAADSLRNGHSRSCGCLPKEILVAMNRARACVA